MRDARDPRVDRPPVEPLSDISWARVERSVFAELDAAPAPVRAPVRRRATWMLAAAPLAAAAAVLFWLVLRTDGPGRDLEHVQRVVTGDTATEVSFGDAAITVSPHSAMSLGGAGDGGVLVVVERGGARFAVAPRHGRPPFHVQAGDVAVRVVGTRFVVARNGDEASVVVQHGTVEVVAHGQRVMVHAGESWRSQTARAADAAPAPTLIEPADTAADAAADAAAGVENETPDVRSADERPARRPRHASKTEPAAEPAPLAMPAMPLPTTKEQFEAASRLERTDATAALHRYEALAEGSGPWAANALFAAGRLRFDGGNADAARRLLTEYLRRFPAGGNAADARALLDRL